MLQKHNLEKMIWFNHDNAKHIWGTVYTYTYRLESIYYWYMQYYFQILTKQTHLGLGLYTSNTLFFKRSFINKFWPNKTML